MRAIQLVAAVAAAAVASVAGGQTVGIATGPQGTPTNATGSAIAKVVNEASGLQTRAIPHTSNDVSMPLVDRGQIEFGIANVVLAGSAANGTGPFKGREAANLRMITRLYPLQVSIIVRKDSGIRSIAELKGKRIPVGYTAQKSVAPMADALLANVGLSLDDVSGVPVPNTSRGTEDFVQGKADGAMLALGAARLQQTDAQVGGIRILGIDPSPAAVARMQEHFTYAYAYPLKPGPRAIGVEEPIHVMAFDIVLVGAASASDEVVYQTVKAMHQGKDKLVAVSPLLRDFDPDRMYAAYKGLTYHPGALRYYQEAGVKPSN